LYLLQAVSKFSFESQAHFLSPLIAQEMLSGILQYREELALPNHFRFKLDNNNLWEDAIF
jgi:hypothetical protein